MPSTTRVVTTLTERTRPPSRWTTGKDPGSGVESTTLNLQQPPVETCLPGSLYRGYLRQEDFFYLTF